MKNKSALFIKDLSFTLTSSLPLALSMGICSGMGISAGAVFTFIITIFFSFVDSKKKMPVYLSLLILTYAFNAMGAASTSLAIIISGLMIIIFSFLKNHFSVNIHPGVAAALALSGALTATVLFTTDYFGIGAEGNLTVEMIKSYISLGFHPNWRGVLYGTIVMVVMITFPRKFKKASAFIDFAFIALVLTTVMNLFLNPPSVINVIDEVGPLSFSEYKNNVLMPLTASFDIKILETLICSAALFFIQCYSASLDDEQNSVISACGGVISCITGFITCFTSPVKLRKSKFISGILAAVICLLLFIVLHDYVARIPIHSCAVILIVGAWNSVKWSEMKKAFSNAEGIVFFIITISSCILIGIAYGIVISCLVSAVYVPLKNKICTKDS